MVSGIGSSSSVSSMLGNAGYSWSVSGKDRDGDGKITRNEFKAPVAPGTGAIVPADLKAGGSLDDAFNAYDHNGDGIIDQGEAKAGARYKQSLPADRFTSNWADTLSTLDALAFRARINRDNAQLAAQWGLTS